MFNVLHPIRLSHRSLRFTGLRRAMSSKSFWNWTTQSRPSWRHDFKEAAVIFTVFGVTGTSSVLLVRPALKHTLGLEVCDYPTFLLQFVFSVAIVLILYYPFLCFNDFSKYKLFVSVG